MVREAKFRMSLIKSKLFLQKVQSVRASIHLPWFTLVYLQLTAEDILKSLAAGPCHQKASWLPYGVESRGGEGNAYLERRRRWEGRRGRGWRGWWPADPVILGPHVMSPTVLLSQFSEVNIFHKINASAQTQNHIIMLFWEGGYLLPLTESFRN